MITNSTPTKKEPVPFLLKVRDVAKLLAISRATVHALIDKGDLYAKQVGPSDKKKRHHVRITGKSLCGFYKKRFGHDLKGALENPLQS